MLEGGWSLVVSTYPRFQLKVTKGSGGCLGIHRDSPAGVWKRQNPDSFHGVDMEFIDPHKVSGFGASTAQFLAVYMWSQLISTVGIKRLWEDYQGVAWGGEGVPPSGADLLGQCLGRVSAFCLESLATSFQWPFPCHGFFIVSTGHKLSTHKHLRKKNSREFIDLKPLSYVIKEAFVERRWSDFILSQKEFYKQLRKKSLTDTRSLHLIQEIQCEDIDFVKPCGALGAEALVVFFEDSHRDYVTSLLERSHLFLVASEKEICEGFRINAHG